MQNNSKGKSNIRSSSTKAKNNLSKVGKTSKKTTKNISKVGIPNNKDIANSTIQNKNRVGFYCWSGPDFVRMTKLKYFNPKIDEQSLMGSYDYEYLKKVKDKFNITDVWATYSWGFSEESEKQQYEFLKSKLDNFKKLNLKVHAYFQGANLVYNDYKDKNWFCKDEYNRLVPYYTQRKVVCLNNPEFVDYLSNKIKKTFNFGFDGIFIDNVHMGQMPIPDFDNKGLFTFAGCNCDVCQKKYKKMYSAKIPFKFDKNNYIDYQDFRVKSTTEFVSKMNKVVKSTNMEFGTNSFDPKYDTKKMFGTDLNELEKHQDYLLFENHSLPSEKKNNLYINDVIKNKNIKKPVFVVTYDKGIGYEPQYNQQQIDNIFYENSISLFNTCLKGSEFVTNGVWHNFDIDNINSPQISNAITLKKIENNTNNLLKMVLKIPYFKSTLKKYYNPLYTKVMESKTARKSMGFLMKSI